MIKNSTLNSLDAGLKLPPRDFLVIGGSLVGVAALCWIYLLTMPRDACCLPFPIWGSAYFWMMFLMWAIMMVGMMVPSAMPMVLIYAAVAKKAEKQGTPIASTGAFTSGYLMIWVLFSFLVTLLQWQLDKAVLLSPMMAANSPKFSAGLLIAAGIYQWLPVKDNCLEACRSPFHFISTHWHSGVIGAFGMGISHGLFCMGCCWLLMLLLFVVGVMNILWIAVLAIFVFLEKVLPLGNQGGKILGILLCMAGAFVLLNSH